MIYLLSLDPGITTGVVMFEKDPERNSLVISRSFVLKKWNLGGLKDFEKPDNVVIEKIPLPTFGPLVDQLREIIWSLSEMYPSAVYVQPGTWKPSYWGQVPLPSMFQTKHEEDAYRMGLYVWNTKLKE
jgi:hypothetical protein